MTIRCLPAMVRSTVVLAGLLFLMAAGCGGGDSAGALANRLADAMGFDDGVAYEGEPPAGNDDVASAPQIAELDPATISLRLGEDFLLRARTMWDPSRGVITGAVVHVVGSRKYVVVTRAVVPATDATGGWWMELTGRLEPDNDTLRGRSFELRVALQLAGGVTGGYRIWGTTVKDEPPVEQNAQTDLVPSGGQYNQGTAPGGSQDEAIPQITSIEGDQVVVPGGSYVLFIFTDFGNPSEIANAIVARPRVLGYYRVPVVPVPGTGGLLMVELSGVMGDGVVPGVDYVMLIALEDRQGRVGEYRPWTFHVPGPEDGDIDGDTLDGDTAIDGDTTDIDGDVDPDPDADGDTTDIDGDVDPDPDGDTGGQTVPAAGGGFGAGAAGGSGASENFRLTFSFGASAGSGPAGSANYRLVPGLRLERR